MIYSDFQDKKISQLAFGAMRLPVKNGNDNEIDEELTTRMVDFAMEHGINYYDTAWGYHGGNSEIVLSKALSKYDRSSYYLAYKFPGYDLGNMPKVKEIFEEQLKKCQTEYFDFYLFHNVCELNVNAYLDPQYAIFDYLIEQKKNGRIKHLGFSAHGDVETMKIFLDRYGEHMEFCQIQLNWLDWDFQDAKKKVFLLNEHDIPIWVMEPLRGGSILDLKEEYLAKMKEMQPDYSPAEWAFHFLQSVPSVKVILSGMSNLEQLSENTGIFAKNDPLGVDETKLLMDIANEMTQVGTVPCTGCHYCTSHCPMELDIPRFMKLYNEHTYSNGGFIAPMALSAIPEDKRPDACIGCRSCESVCPQKIEISEIMRKFADIHF
ncbi:MAG: aldo/keto reductase [Dehalococcoidales bacterium]|nr:aldo/keto reductase [Dehalococcoidales bacterium]